jgi:hypothetical protein
MLEAEHAHIGEAPVEEPASAGGRPSHWAAIMRMMCPLENAGTSLSR